MQARIIGSNVWIHDDVILGVNVVVGHSSCLGYGRINNHPTTIGNDVSLGAFCVISHDTIVSDNVEIDHYCRIDPGSKIGKGSKILYGVQIFENVIVGENCIVGGDLIDRAVLEENVTYMGRMAHTYRQPGTIQDWDILIQPSPIIRARSVIGENALIVGGLEIGPDAYIGAGEIVRTNIPPSSVLYKGRISKIEDWRGIINTRK